MLSVLIITKSKDIFATALNNFFGLFDSVFFFFFALTQFA